MAEERLKLVGGGTPATPPKVDNGGGGDNYDPMNIAERLGKVEEAVAGLRHSQNLTLGATIGVGGLLLTIMLGLGIYTLQRIDNLPNEFNQITQGITNAITATRTVDQRQAPIIIQLPAAPQAPAEPAK